MSRFVLHQQEVDQIKEVSWSKMLCHGDIKSSSLRQKRTSRIVSDWQKKKCSVIASSKGWRGRYSNHLNLSVPPYCPNICYQSCEGFFLYWCFSVEEFCKSKRQIGQKTKVWDTARQKETNASSSSSWLFHLPSTLCSPVNTCCPHLPTTLSSDWAFSCLCPSTAQISANTIATKRLCHSNTSWRRKRVVFYICFGLMTRCGEIRDDEIQMWGPSVMS